MGIANSSMLTQLFPPKPAFTEKSIPDLQGMVYIVTGSNTGVGKELARLLYSRNGRVYIAARSEAKALSAIEDIERSAPRSKGALRFLRLDLADLATIKATVEKFTGRESRLHVLFNNAGVMYAGADRTAQGHEMHLGVNVLGTFLLTKLLTPTLAATARAEQQQEEEERGTAGAAVRVVWVASQAAEMFAARSVGMPMDDPDCSATERAPLDRYGLSKVGNWAHAAEYAKRVGRQEGIVSVALNPGNLASELYREQRGLFRLLTRMITYPCVNGAYTELFAGLSPEVTMGRTGGLDWVIPFGRIQPIRKDLIDAIKSEAEGGTDGNAKFWDWTEEQVRPFV